MSSALLTLYRPTGQAELDLIAQSGWRAFPPRLPHQPIFYPVLTEAYALEIARDWNTKDQASGFIGHVTRFRVPQTVLEAYPVQTAGAARHQELWVPAEDLGGFNDLIHGPIELLATYRPPTPGRGFPHMLRFEVFGRRMGLERDEGAWKMYDLSSAAGRRTVANIIVPPDLIEAELGTFLADLFHESARPDRPGVRLVED